MNDSTRVVELRDWAVWARAAARRPQLYPELLKPSVLSAVAQRLSAEANDLEARLEIEKKRRESLAVNGTVRAPMGRTG